MTREEAIRILKNFSLCGAYHQLVHMNDTDSEAISMAIKALEQTEPQWIPTKESPPKKEGFYLVQRKYQSLPFILWFGIDPRYPRGNNNCVQRFWCDECEDAPVPLDMEHILAWMPLPKPYKDKEGEA